MASPSLAPAQPIAERQELSPTTASSSTGEGIAAATAEVAAAPAVMAERVVSSAAETRSPDIGAALMAGPSASEVHAAAEARVEPVQNVAGQGTAAVESSASEPTLAGSAEDSASSSSVEVPDLSPMSIDENALAVESAERTPDTRPAVHDVMAPPPVAELAQDSMAAEPALDIQVGEDMAPSLSVAFETTVSLAVARAEVIEADSASSMESVEHTTAYGMALPPDEPGEEDASLSAAPVGSQAEDAALVLDATSLTAAQPDAASSDAPQGEALVASGNAVEAVSVQAVGAHSGTETASSPGLPVAHESKLDTVLPGQAELRADADAPTSAGTSSELAAVDFSPVESEGGATHPASVLDAHADEAPGAQIANASAAPAPASEKPGSATATAGAMTDAQSNGTVTTSSAESAETDAQSFSTVAATVGTTSAAQPAGTVSAAVAASAMSDAQPDVTEATTAAAGAMSAAQLDVTAALTAAADAMSDAQRDVTAAVGVMSAAQSDETAAASVMTSAHAAVSVTATVAAGAMADVHASTAATVTSTASASTGAGADSTTAAAVAADATTTANAVSPAATTSAADAATDAHEDSTAATAAAMPGHAVVAADAAIATSAVQMAGVPTTAEPAQASSDAQPTVQANGPSAAPSDESTLPPPTVATLAEHAPQSGDSSPAANGAPESHEAPAHPEPVQPAPRAPIELDDIPVSSNETMELASTWEFVGWQGHDSNGTIGHTAETTWADRAVDIDGPAVAPPASDVPLASAWDFIQQPWQPPTAQASELVTSLLAAASASTDTPSTGPAVTAEQVLAALEGVGTQGTLGKVLLAYCAGRFRRAFLLGESFGLARVGHAWGPGSDSPAVSSLKVDLEAPSLLTTAMSSGPSIFNAPTCAQDEAIFAALGGDSASHLLVATVRSRGRPVAFVIADHGEAPVDAGALEELTRIVERASEAFARLPTARGA